MFPVERFLLRKKQGTFGHNQEGGRHFYEDKRTLKIRGKTEHFAISMVSSVGYRSNFNRHWRGTGENECFRCPILVIAFGDSGMSGIMGCGSAGLFLQTVWKKKIARNQRIPCYFYSILSGIEIHTVGAVCCDLIDMVF